MRTNANVGGREREPVGDGLYDISLVSRAASVVANATVTFLLATVVMAAIAPRASGQKVTTSTTATTSPISVINPPSAALSEVDRLTVESTYKDAVLASAEVQRIQAAVLAASPDYQKALVEFNESAAKYNELVARLQGNLPKGSTIAMDPVTRKASVKPPEPPAPVTKSDAPTPKK